MNLNRYAERNGKMLVTGAQSEKSYEAYMTIYMLLTILVIMSLVTVLFDGVRRNTIRTESEIVMDTAMNAALAEYHRELFEQYGLLFIDSAYGNEMPSQANTAEHVRNYMNHNFENLSLVKMNADSVAVLENSIASDEEGQVLYNQILEYMGEYTGLSSAERLMENMKTVSSYKLDTRNVDQEWEKNAKEIASQPTPQKKTKKKQLNIETGEIEEVEESEDVPIENPGAVAEGMRKLGVLQFVMDNPEQVSNMAVNLSQYLSSRTNRIVGNGPGPEQQQRISVIGKNKITSKAMLSTYLFQKCGFYKAELEKSHLKYQIEYLIGGKASDTENLKTVANKLLLMREVSNVTYLSTNPVKKAEITAMASGIAAVALAPYLQPLLEASILFSWAYAESLQDVKVLFRGGKIPILKNNVTWQTDLESIFRPDHLGEGISTSDGLNYQNYLQVLVYMETEQNLLYRFMDVCEMDIRQTKNNENFRMDACIDSFQACAVVSAGSGMKLNIIRRYMY